MPDPPMRAKPVVWIRATAVVPHNATLLMAGLLCLNMIGF
jgi:hypothetical protein